MAEEKHPLPPHTLRIKKLKSLLAITNNAVKSDNYLFRNLYAEENGKEIDILEDGLNSCAIFVNFILLALGLVKSSHATVYSTEKDLVVSGWYEIEKPKPGAIIVWEKKVFKKGLLGNNNIQQSHIGFCVGEGEAVSNGSQGSGFPMKHHITYGTNPDGAPVRKIEKIYWHDQLND